MLSRLVRPVPSALGSLGQLNAFQPSQVLAVRFAATVPATTTERKTPTIVEVLKSNAVSKVPEGPERDLVNFPRPKRLIDPPAVTLGFIPEHYFQFFYPKLGATGGWSFAVGFATYLCSKELYVFEHEFWNGTSLFFLVAVVAIKFGKQIGDYAGSLMQKEADELNTNKFGEIDDAKQAIEDEKLAQWQGAGYKMLFDAKRDNVALQLEATYRERLMTVYNDVKRKLDFQVEKQNVERNVEQKHMVNWIIDKVTKSITAEQEQENIKKCISDLKLLAARA